MKQSTFSKHLTLWMIFTSYGLYAVSSLGLGLLYATLASDVLFADSWLPYAVSLLIETVQVLLIPSICFAILAYASFQRETAVKPLRLLWVYFGSLLFCRVADLGLALGLRHALSLSDDLIPAIWYFLLDTVFALILYTVIRTKVKQLRREEELQTRAALLSSSEASVKRVFISIDPHGSLYSKENPLLRCTLLLSVIYTAVRLGERILYDILYSIEAASLPAPKEIPVMIAYYLGDLLLGVCFFLLGRLVLGLLFPSEKQ